MTLLPKIKLKMVPTFPANVIGGVGLEATRSNGAVTIDYAWQEFGSFSSIPTAPTSMILTYDTATNAYSMVPSHLLGGAASGIADAAIDGTDYVRNSGNWQHPSFLQAGTGATLRTMQNKARDLVSVKDFGAVGDGVANDRVAIQKAIDAVNVGRGTSGGTVYFPSGLYLIEGGTAALRNNFGVTLRGESTGSSIIVNGNTNLPAIEVGNVADGVCYGNVIENLCFGCKLGITPVTGQCGISFTNQVQLKVANIKVSKFPFPAKLFDGIIFENVNVGQIGNLVVFDTINDGVRMHKSGGMAGTGFMAHACGRYGFLFVATGGLYLHGGDIWNCGASGVSFQHGEPGTLCQYVFFTSWIVDTSGSDNWYINDLQDSVMTGCWASSQQSAAVNPGANGITMVGAGCKNITWVDPVALNNNASAMRIYDDGVGSGSPRQIRVVTPIFGNDTTGNGVGGAVGARYGLMVNGASDVTIIGGQMINNVDGAVSNTSSGNFIMRDVTNTPASTTWQPQNAPVYRAYSPPATAWNFDGSGSTVTVAGNGALGLAVGAGLIVISEISVTGATAIWLVSQGVCILVSQVTSGWVASTATPGTNNYSINFNGSNYVIYNGRASAVTFSIAMLKCRATN